MGGSIASFLTMTVAGRAIMPDLDVFQVMEMRSVIGWFILLPLVLASGAGANAQKSIGIAVLTGMLGSTILTVTFVPSVFVVMQRLEEWRARRKAARKSAAPPAPSPAA